MPTFDGLSSVAQKNYFHRPSCHFNLQLDRIGTGSQLTLNLRFPIFLQVPYNVFVGGHGGFSQLYFARAEVSDAANSDTGSIVVVGQVGGVDGELQKAHLPLGSMPFEADTYHVLVVRNQPEKAVSTETDLQWVRFDLVLEIHAVPQSNPISPTDRSNIAGHKLIGFCRYRVVQGSLCRQVPLAVMNKAVCTLPVLLWLGSPT